MVQIITWNKEDEITTDNTSVLLDSNRPDLTEEEFETVFIGQHETPPESAEENQLYFDSDGVMYEYVNNEWNAITEIKEVSTVNPLKNLVIYSFPNEYEIVIDENKTIVKDENSNEYLVIADVNSSNSNLYNVDSFPEEKFAAHKYRYTLEEGYIGPLDTWVDPSVYR